MTSWTHFLWEPWWENVVRTLLHTLWQAALCAAVLSVVLRRLPARRAQLRYRLALGALALIVCGTLLTWAIHQVGQAQADSAAVASTQTASPMSVAETSAETGAVNEAPVLFDVQTQASSMALEPSRSAWIAACSLTWIAGLTVMLARLAFNVASARRLIRAADVADERIDALVGRLQPLLGVTRRVRVVISDSFSRPAVWGIVWPTLILPTSAATGVPTDQLLAVLAHELAHVRRYDCLVNLLQMLVEAVLFFNPAVWWISRQVRLEREACCDALAVAVTGEPLTYVKTLTDWAGRMRESRQAVLNTPALVPNPRHNVLVERVRRILRPDDGPELRLSAWGALGLLLLTAVALAGLGQGTLSVVAVAAEIMSPAERIRKLREVEREYAHPGESVDLPVVLKGTVRTPDGGPLPDDIRFHSDSDRPGHSSSTSHGPRRSPFSIEVPRGVIYLMVTAEGYAPTVVGPLDGRGGETIDDIEIVLDPGFRAQVRLVDEAQRPVANATLRGGMRFHGSASQHRWTTDEQGLAIIGHAGEKPYQFQVDASGYESLIYKDVKLRREGDCLLTVPSARPTTGVVTDTDGVPVAGARIRVYGIAGPQPNHNHSFSARFGPVLATTDDSGTFTLDRLVDNANYTLVVEGEKRRRLVWDVTAGQSGLAWTLGPELRVTGRLTGNLDRLKQRDGQPVVRFGQSIQLSKGHVDATGGGYAEVQIRDGLGTFVIPNLLQGELTLTAADESITLQVSKPIDDLLIEIPDEPVAVATRPVEVRLVTAEGDMVGDGQIAVSSYVVNDGRAESWQQREIDLSGGVARFDAPAGGRASLKPTGLVGYWFADEDFDVPPGVAALQFDIPVDAAGAIRGRLLDVDGSPAVESVSLQAVAVDKPPVLAEEHPLLDVSAEPGAGGRFLLSPLPLGGTYRVKVSRGRMLDFSELVRLDAESPIGEVTLQLSEGVTSRGRVLGPDDKPLAGIPVTLRFEHPQAGTTYASPTLTDADGQFAFAELNPTIGDYWADLHLRKDFVPTQEKLRGDGAAITIRLQRGLALKGQVVDAATGWPIPGVEMFAHLPPSEYRPGSTLIFEAESKTDGEGRFYFSNLPDRPLKINDRSGLNWTEGQDDRTVIPGSPEPLLIRGALPEWSKLRPKPPAEEAEPVSIRNDRTADEPDKAAGKRPKNRNDVRGNLIGAWQRGSFLWFGTWTFFTDGRFTHHSNMEPKSAGTWQLDGNRLTITTSESADAEQHAEWTMRIVRIDDEVLEIAGEDDSQSPSKTYRWKRVKVAEK